MNPKAPEIQQPTSNFLTSMLGLVVTLIVIGLPMFVWQSTESKISEIGANTRRLELELKETQTTSSERKVQIENLQKALATQSDQFLAKDRVLDAITKVAEIEKSLVPSQDIEKIRQTFNKYATNDLLLEVRADVADLKARKIRHENSATGHEAVVTLIEQVEHLMEHRSDEDVIQLKVQVADMKEQADQSSAMLLERATTIATLTGKIERSLLLIQSLDERMKKEEDNGRSNKEQVAKIGAAVGAAFTEVESQLRGMDANRNLEIADVWRWLQALGDKAGIKINNKEFFSTDIPAKSRTTIGEINGK